MRSSRVSAGGKGSWAALRADLESLRAERPDLDGYPIVWEIPEYPLITSARERARLLLEIDVVLPDES